MPINPHILTWARETAGLSVEDAARQLQFKDTRDRSAADRLTALEAGTEEPSRSVLTRMTQLYHRSLLVFYLNEPPRQGDRGQDFRRAPGHVPEYDPTLDALIRDIRGRQGIVKDLLEQADAKPVDYVASVTTATEAAELVRRITERLSFSLAEFRRQATTDAAFTYLREKIETAGVYVLLLGNLGSYQTNISGRSFRGYAIADPIAPFIVINDQDAKISWAFTALHELTHIWLGATGISGDNNDTQLESYCNSIAAEMLLPEGEIDELRNLRNAPMPQTLQAISQFATVRKISRAMVAYKLLRVNIINNARWRELDQHYEQEWLAAQARPGTEDRGEGGPSYYVVRRHRLGRALVELIRNSLSEGFITHTRAGRVLGVKPRNVDPLIYMAGMRGGR